MEIVDVLAIKNGDDGSFDPEERLLDPTDIIVVCSSLISYSGGGDNDYDDQNDDGDNRDHTNDCDWGDNGNKQGHSNQIRLAYFSVKEYLLSDRCAYRLSFQS